VGGVRVDFAAFLDAALDARARSTGMPGALRSRAAAGRRRGQLHGRAVGLVEPSSVEQLAQELDARRCRRPRAAPRACGGVLAPRTATLAPHPAGDASHGLSQPAACGADRERAQRREPGLLHRVLGQRRLEEHATRDAPQGVGLALQVVGRRSRASMLVVMVAEARTVRKISAACARSARRESLEEGDRVLRVLVADVDALQGLVERAGRRPSARTRPRPRGSPGCRRACRAR
jgi:hypothetical protein